MFPKLMGTMLVLDPDLADKLEKIEMDAVYTWSTFMGIDKPKPDNFEPITPERLVVLTQIYDLLNDEPFKAQLGEPHGLCLRDPEAKGPENGTTPANKPAPDSLA